MAESKTKSTAAKTLAKEGTSKAKKKVAAKVLASDKPNQAVAEAAVQEASSKARDLAKTAVEHVGDIDVPHLADEATELVADGAEAVADQFTTVAKVSRRISGRDISLILAGATVGAAVGGYVGFRIAEKRMRTRFDELLESETNQIREHYHQKLRAREGEDKKPSIKELATLDAAAQEKAEAIAREQGYVQPEEESQTLSTEGKTPADIMREAPETEQMREVAEEGRELREAAPGGTDRTAERERFVQETRNIFAERDAAEIPEWDYAVEIKSRNPTLPYVIHVDEYRENPAEHEQRDLTYYEGDGILSGENDAIIEDADEAIGLENLNRFGHGGGDANTVHIRNEVREIDYEVVRSQGSFAQEVHGFDPDEVGLQHSDRPSRGRRSFRDDE